MIEWIRDADWQIQLAIPHCAIAGRARPDAAAKLASLTCDSRENAFCNASIAPLARRAMRQ